MGMREDCKQFESRSYPNGDTVRKCNLDLAPEAPWRCPADCTSYERRRVDVNWSYGSLVTPPTPEAPSSLSSDDGSIAALLDEAEDIVNQAGPAILAEMEAEQLKSRRAGVGVGTEVGGELPGGRHNRKLRRRMKKAAKRKNKKRRLD